MARRQELLRSALKSGPAPPMVPGTSAAIRATTTTGTCPWSHLLRLQQSRLGIPSAAFFLVLDRRVRSARSLPPPPPAVKAMRAAVLGSSVGTTGSECLAMSSLSCVGRPQNPTRTRCMLSMLFCKACSVLGSVCACLVCLILERAMMRAVHWCVICG